jgi:Large polyvalent protein associated domain 29
MMTEPIESREAARQIRSALKVAFPGASFAVTSKDYRGVNIEWIDDGPTEALLQATLVKAKCAEAKEHYGVIHHYANDGKWIDFCRYNVAERVASELESKRRQEEYAEHQRRADQAVIEARGKRYETRPQPQFVAEAVPTPEQQKVFYDAIEALRLRAEADLASRMAQETEAKRRPSWAPPLNH